MINNVEGIVFVKDIAWMIKKFGIILVHASLRCVYHVTKTVQAIKGTCCGW